LELYSEGGIGYNMRGWKVPGRQPNLSWLGLGKWEGGRVMEDLVFAANVRAALAMLRERRVPGLPWVDGENLPWDESAFSQRMLREHLDQAHAAASRPLGEILIHVEGLERELKLSAGDRILDVTCGPGLYCHELARRGYRVTGVDFAPAAIGYAREKAAEEGLDCTFVQQDVRQMDFYEEFGAAILLYGQPNAFTQHDAASLLRRVAKALVPNGRFIAEVHNIDCIDKEQYTDWEVGESGLFGDYPQLCLHEQFWNEEEQAALDRYYILDMETGEMHEYAVCEQGYTLDGYRALLAQAGLKLNRVYGGWDGHPASEDDEWFILCAEKAAA
jgi:SAM-dependent methyltransferase